MRQVFNNKTTRSCLPNTAKKLNVQLAYTYNPPIGLKLFNYNKVLSEVSQDDIDCDQCDCESKFSNFIYTPHGHVHTGNLDIIENIPLRKLMKMGAKFREIPTCTKKQILTKLFFAIDKCAHKLSRRCSRPLQSFENWINSIKKQIKHKLDFLFDKYKYPPEVLKQTEVEEYLKYIHARFVIVPVDKASNNFSIICKKFYINTLMQELGFQQGVPKGNSVYSFTNLNLSGVCESHCSKLKDLNIRLTKENCHIPYLYWTSKQHKNPYKFRFISGAKHCTTKQISLEVALALKCIKQQFKNYCGVIKRHTGISHYWSVDNSHEVVNKISNIKANSIETYDFSTLYTNLPLDTIYKDLERLIIKMYKNSGSHTLLVNPYLKKCFWYNGNFYAGYKKYTIDKLLLALHFILYETYIQFGGFIFQQKIGIPMGGNASPFIADLFLAWREYKFITDNIKNNFALVKKLSNNSRYIDDILVLNYLDFGELAEKIYPKELILEKSSPYTKRENFLDLHIRIIDNIFVTGIYHKVDDFNFEVINFPFPESNIESSLGYKTFYSQLVRFARLCSCVADFYYRTQLTFSKLLNRGYDCGILKKYFIRFCNKYNWVLTKYNHSNIFSLWDACLQFDPIVTVRTCDSNSIKALTKIAEIKITDLYENIKKGYMLKPCSVNVYTKYGVETSSIPKVETNKSPIVNNSNNSIFTDSNNSNNLVTGQYASYLTSPIGIRNPKFHCYLNSVIQVFIRILSFHLQCFDRINDNEEGIIFRYFKDILQTDFKYVYNLKQHLATYDPKLNGNEQQDANECFDIICKILDAATKYSLLGDDNDEEAYICNFTKEVFSHTIQTSSKCTKCNNTCFAFSTSFVHVVTPTDGQNVSTLIANFDKLTSSKYCIMCNLNTSHQYFKDIHIPPKVLIIVLNRSGFRNGMAIKNKFNVYIDEGFTLKNDTYRLFAIIHHHGDSSRSGHYTSYVKYNTFYLCNDIHIKPLNLSFPLSSQSAYILAYERI